MLISNGPPTQAQLWQLGALLAVQIEPPAPVRATLTAVEQTVAPAQLAALIDTGASVSGVDTAALRALGLTPVNTTVIGGVAGPNPHGVYIVDLHIPFGPQRYSFLNRQVIEVNLGPPYQALLGRDILSMLMFVYQGPTGIWTVAG